MPSLGQLAARKAALGESLAADLRAGVSQALKRRLAWQISLGNLSDRLGGMSFAGRITRSRAPDELVRIAAKTASAPAPGPASPAPESQPAPPRTRAEILAALAERVSAAQASGRGSPQTIAANLEAELAVGPADEAAFYDFPVLHIAWKDVWERALDGKTREEIAGLYREIVEIVPPEFVPKGDVAEVSELKDMLADLSVIVTEVTAVTLPPAVLNT